MNGGCKPPFACAASFSVLGFQVIQMNNKTKEEDTMTKAELIEALAADAGISKKEAGEALTSLIGGITASLKKKDGKIVLPNFGSFKKARRKARKGFNPRTGEKITIKAHNVIKFQAAKALKEAV
jgi:DNA-binding protein HU-beta